MTEAATVSPFVFHEVLFADWLGKKLLTAMFKSTWKLLRPSLKAVLGKLSSKLVLKLYVDDFCIYILLFYSIFITTSAYLVI